MTTAISVAGLHKSFGRTRALDGLDLEVAAGEVHGFLGPNGAGKTTTLRILLSLLRADGGTVRLLDGDPREYQTTDEPPASITRRTGNAVAASSRASLAGSACRWARRATVLRIPFTAAGSGCCLYCLCTSGPCTSGKRSTGSSNTFE